MTRWHKHKFIVTVCCWPYKKGYGTLCKKCSMVLDTGIPTREDAEYICTYQNQLEKERRKRLLSEIFPIFFSKSA